MATIDSDNSSPDVTDHEENNEQWGDDSEEIELNNIMQATATPVALHSSSSSSALSTNLPPKKRKSAMSRKVSKASSSGRKKEITPKMQDRQARGKDAAMFSSEDDSSDMDGNPKYNPYENAEIYEARQRRRLAAVILDNPELLMMHAQSRNDSIPGTRHYFAKLLAGYQDDAGSAGKFREEWEKGVRGKAKGKGKRGYGY
ncbi:uncharacterized protein LY89DRAFT_785018 [Mollisia scopiformis]|uniref:Uncharacterized protein n=1 Tax=Mollisia scopiformis TaxID=149040 RepID=A0A194WZB0_MOLSC|nr:uncharacterized protein LY89DRAFT_785018 [Mollisia scopiformis]KUJ13288.1 hypothetical protein LY89DRAFT_785018 [Mollisia scopiformis]